MKPCDHKWAVIKDTLKVCEAMLDRSPDGLGWICETPYGSQYVWNSEIHDTADAAREWCAVLCKQRARELRGEK